MSLPHPFPYQGSKRNLAAQILPLLLPDMTAFIEPFAGSAAMSIAVRHAGHATPVTLNDLNAPLMAMWRHILDDPHALADRYAETWDRGACDPKAWFRAVRAEFNRTHDPALLLYLLNRIVKGSVRYSLAGDFNQSADNRRLGARPDVVRDRLTRTSETLAGATTRCESFETLLIDAPSGAVVYLDPPYQGTSGMTADRRYCAGLARTDFETVLKEANRHGVSYLVSYDQVRDDERYGQRLDPALNLTHLHLHAGRSTQATLAGRTDTTTESLYLSPALVARIDQTRRSPI